MPSDSRKRRRKGKTTRRQPTALIIGAVVVVALLIIGAVYVTQSNKVEALQTFPDQGNAHLPEAPETYLWNSRPPTSGPHSSGIAPWGVHTESVPDWNQVHNLEDGGVIIHYNCPDGCADVVNELREIVDDVEGNLSSEQKRLILHPYTNMESRIAVTAWTKMITMDEVDRDQIMNFIDQYRGVDHHPR